MSYPIYILDWHHIAFPEGKVDIDHSEFWEKTVARIVARYFHLPLEQILNLPYCQRRARINGKIIYYGEKMNKKTRKSMLSLIENGVGESGLSFVYDDHEKRSLYDVHEFLSICFNSP